MATVNIGSLKFNWKGAYNGSTAYAVDDVTEYNGSSYICILASTGNLPTNTTYFQPMATKGTDGTDVGTTLTTQGDILYRDGSGLARLAAGTNGQVLQTGGSGANPSWGTVSSDFVKLAGGNVTSGGSFNIDGYFTNTYDVFKLIGWGRTAWHKMRFRFSDGTYTSGNYVWVVNYATRTSSSNSDTSSGAWNNDNIPLSYWSGDNSNEYHHYEATFIRPWDDSGYAKNVFVNGWDYNSSELHVYNNAGYLDGNKYNSAVTGLHIFPTSGTMSDTSWILYGLKA